MFIPKLQYLILKWKERKGIELRHFYSIFTRNQKVWSGSYLFCFSFVHLTEEEKLFFLNSFIEVYLIYKEVQHILNVYNLMSLDICKLLRYHHHNQGNRPNNRFQKFPVSLLYCIW